MEQTERHPRLSHLMSLSPDPLVSNPVHVSIAFYISMRNIFACIIKKRIWNWISPQANNFLTEQISKIPTTSCITGVSPVIPKGVGHFCQSPGTVHLPNPEEEVSSALGASHSPQNELPSLRQRAEEVLEISRFLLVFFWDYIWQETKCRWIPWKVTEIRVLFIDCFPQVLCINHCHFHFSSVQSLSHVWLFATPWIAARLASLSTTNFRSLLKLMSIELVNPSRYLILCCPLLLLPPIPPRIRVFSNESALRIKWPKYWSFSFSISPSHEHPGLISFRMDGLDILAVQGVLKSLLQHHSSVT